MWSRSSPLFEKNRSACRSLIVACVLSAAAHAEPVAVTLTHIRAEGALTCPDEVALKGSVVARLGYEPFVAAASLRAVTRIERIGKLYSATLELIREGEAPRSRTLSSDSSDCRDLFDSLALALTLAIDPQFLVREPPSRAPLQPPQSLPPQQAPSELQPEPAPVDFVVHAGAQGSIGLSPRPGVGGHLGLGVRYRAIAVFIEGRVDVPSSVPLAGGAVSTNLFLGTLLPCFQWQHFGACLSVGVGALQVEGHLAFGRRESSPLVKTGVRLQYEWMFFRHLGLLLHGEVDAIPTRITVYADEVPVWSTSPVFAELGLGILTVF